MLPPFECGSTALPPCEYINLAMCNGTVSGASYRLEWLVVTSSNLSYFPGQKTPKSIRELAVKKTSFYQHVSDPRLGALPKTS
jgi:hypothetical protein